MSSATEEIDGYRILYNKFVGQGAYATIHECENANIKGPLCVKALRLNTRHAELFKREVAILQKIQQFSHKNLIAIYHIAQQNNVQYIFMKKYQSNLEQWLMEKKKEKILLSLTKIFDFIKQIVNGYKQLYNHKIVHRDLKPENILLGENDDLKISDYGLGKILEDVKAAGQHTMQGTPMYASPQCLIDGNYSSKTDVYSLGVIVYYLTFQEHLFTAKSLVQLANQIKEKLENRQISLPQIKNEGSQDQISELVDFLKLTVTYSEDDRIGWEDLFEWFPEGQQNFQNISQLFQSQRELLMSKQINIRQSQQINISNQSFNNQNNSQKIQQSTDLKISNRSNKSSETLNQIQIVEAEKLWQSQDKNSSSTDQDHNQQQQNNFQNQSLQYSQATSNQQEFSILASVLDQIQKSTVHNDQSINRDSEQFEQQQFEQAKSSSPSESLNYQSGLQEQFQHLKQSLTNFCALQYQSCNFKQSQPLQQPQGKLKLKRKTENSLFRLIEIILAKAELTDNTKQSLELISSRAELKQFTFHSIILQLLLVGYKLSLFLNGFSLFDRTVKHSIIQSKMSDKILPKEIDEYIKCETADIQHQQQCLLEQYENTLETVDIFLKQFYSEETQKLNKDLPIVTIFRLFNNPSQLCNYNLFIGNFNQHFRVLAKKINEKVDIETNIDCLKFMAYALKFSTQEDEYPLEKFSQLDKEMISFVTDDVNSLNDYIWLNLPNLS